MFFLCITLLYREGNDDNSSLKKKQLKEVHKALILFHFTFLDNIQHILITKENNRSIQIFVDKYYLLVWIDISHAQKNLFAEIK